MDISDADERAESPSRSPRVLRMAALVAVAVIVVGIASFTYLHPNFKFGTSASSLQIRSNPVEGRFVTMAFRSPSHGWVVVDDRAGRLWVFVTHDAGRHWTAQLSIATAKPGAELQLFDATGVILTLQDSPLLYRTTDAGLHWYLLPTNGLNVHSASFVDADHGWLVASLPDFKFGWVLYRTVDAGKTWTNLGVPVEPGDTMEGVHFSTPTQGWLDARSASRNLYATVDGGESWRQLPVLAPAAGWPEGPYVVAAHMLPPSGVVATVAPLNRPAIQRFGPPTDLTSLVGSLRGEQNIPSAQLPVALGLTAPGATFTFASAARLTVPPSFDALPPLAPAYQVAMSANGGLDWFAENPTFGVAGQADPLHWWWTYGGLLFKSADGGGTWNVQVSDHSISLDPWTMQVLDGDNAWMSGSISSADSLLETRNGGATWVRVALPRV